MSAARIPIFFFLLLISVINLAHANNEGNPVCYRIDEFPDPEPADCQNAINMIPSGKYELEGRITKPLNLHLPQTVCNRKFFLPAAFLSRTCLIKVIPEYPGHKAFIRPTKAASAMYTIVWPTVRRLATEIMPKCIRNPRGTNWGAASSTSNLEGSVFSYFVQVAPVPPGMQRDGWKLLDDAGFRYNVYEAGGTSSGNCTKGVWSMVNEN
ncbi:hypothetical protein MMC30_004810 [Trapelia coarctata]|nr:hypothetical protein [Trapelia coarctata]